MQKSSAGSCPDAANRTESYHNGKAHTVSATELLWLGTLQPLPTTQLRLRTRNPPMDAICQQQ